MHTAKKLALFLLLFPLAFLAIGLTALVTPAKARRIVRDAVAEYRKRAR